jgi:diguanylate cyclase (GGDEF)-like protein
MSAAYSTAEHFPMDSEPVGRAAADRWWRVGVVVVVGAAVTAGALLLLDFHATAREALEDRFDGRVRVAARFVSTYVDQLADTEREVAEKHLAGPSVPRDDFDQVTETFGFDAAVLLDDRGRLVHVYPPRPAMIGQSLGGEYPHLAVALAGDVGVSNVVPSVAERVPIVAVAVPFETPQGRRVFSGAYSVSKTPLAAFLRNSTPIRPNRVYLVDELEQIVAKTGSTLAGVRPLRAEDPRLARLVPGSARGTYTQAEGPQFFAASKVTGTPWRLITAVPSASLFAPVEQERWIPWLVLAGFSLALSSAGWLFLSNVEARRRLAGAYRRLETVSRTDALTDVFIRRHMNEQLLIATSRARRHGDPLAVLMIDVDRFKQINDEHGHSVGDQVLAEVAARLRGALRAVDVLGRWGGEEFVVIAERTPIMGASRLGERLRDAVGSSPVAVDSSELHVTVSVGVACAMNPDDIGGLVDRADRAMYDAKRGGRDMVVVA